jgi:signal transduction histidine kinase
MMKRSSTSKTKGAGDRGIRKLPLFWIAVLPGMAVLLVMVAVLQYQWATELSAAAEVRIGGNLQSQMTRWHRDLYDELSAICIALQVGPDSGAHDAWNDYLQRYADIIQTGANQNLTDGVHTNPQIIRDIYIWQTSLREKPNLLRLDPDAKNLENSNVPKELETLLARLRANSSNLGLSLRAWQFRSSPQSGQADGGNQISSFGLRSNALAGWQFDQNIPAIVHPMVHHGQPFDSNTPVSRKAIDWLVVVLNFQVIQNRILPELAIRHFGDGIRLEYKLAVVATGDRPSLIYSSDSPFGTSNIGNLDSTMKIFGSATDNIVGDTPQSATQGRISQSEEWRNFAAPVWFPVIQYTSQDQPWVLIVQHRTGPVTAIATSIWHRDLITGGVVLLLLAGNMGLVVFASHREHKFAKVQMDFVASVSHELLTPLAAIYCTGQNFTDGLVHTKTDSIAHGSIITTQARQLTDLVKQILLFASTENGTDRYNLRPLQVSGILQTVRSNVAVLVEGAGFNVEQQVQAGLPCVMGDLSALSQCLQNLISNAVKYSGTSRWIGISASVHEMKNHHKEVHISVQDHGSGISSFELKHIFDPFYRSPAVVDAQIHGTGLGLAVAKRIAEAMEGRLSVTSEVGVGSTFTLHLPVTMKSDAEMASFVPQSI